MKELLSKIAAHFKINPSEITLQKILHGKREKHNVHKLRIRGKDYLLKQHDVSIDVTGTGFTPYQIENFALSTLYKGECRVPQIVWKSEEHKTLLLSWCGDETLDSCTQNRQGKNLMPLLHTILIEMCKIEGFIAKHSAQFKHYMFQFDLKKNLRQLLKQGRKIIGYLGHLSKTPPTTTQVQHLDDVWNSIANRLLSVQPTLGGLDYQANNIVIDEQLPYFIDFGSIGWDWQERRFVQYFNSIGAYQEGSNFISLLNRELVDKYAKWVSEHRENCSITDVVTWVDGHHLLFYLSIIQRILETVTNPEKSDNKILVEAWGDMKLRFRHAISLIINSRFSDDNHTNYIRDMIAEFQSE